MEWRQHTKAVHLHSNCTRAQSRWRFVLVQKRQAQGPLREKVAAEAKATAKLKAYLHDMGEQLGAALQAIAALRAAIERTDAKVDAIGADNLNVRGRVGVLEQ